MPDPPIPAERLGPPEGPPPLLPPETALVSLPFERLLWSDFERLCLRLAQEDAEGEHAQLYGTPGQRQDGIDFYRRLAEGGYCVYQCKRYATLGPADIRQAVDEFLAGSWAGRASRLVFCTSHSGVVTQRADVIEEQAARLRDHKPPVSFEVWDAEYLADRLRARSDLVRLFFGPDALRRFNPAAFGAEQLSTLEAVIAQAMLPPQIVDLSSAPPKLKHAYDSLPATGRAQMLAVLGDHPGEETIASVITHPPSGIRGGGSAEWRVLAAEAERVGLWGCAARAWEEVAKRAETDDARVRALGDGAAAAGVKRDAELQASLGDRARAIDPVHPRVLLMDLHEDMTAEEQLLLIDGAHSEDPGLESLIHNHRVLAHLRLGDLESAQNSLDISAGLAPGSATIKMLRVSLAVQRGRLDLVAHRPLRGEALRAAIADAAEARDQLLEQRRYGEAVRLLMLGSDALLLQGNRAAAVKLLGCVSAEELAEPDAPEVLGDAALRVVDFRLALRLTEGAALSDSIERIRAAATIETGNAQQRTEALETLDRLVAGGGPEADEAAFARLNAALGSPHIPWSMEARDRLGAGRHTSTATVLEANYLAHRANDPAGAQALLEEQGDELWALIGLLRLGLSDRLDVEAITEVADRVLASGPSQAVRVECGMAYARAAKFDRAHEVLVGVARDPGSPDAIRADAYDLLVRISGHERTDWPRAHEYLMEWIDLAPSDARASAWRPTVANRRARA